MNALLHRVYRIERRGISHAVRVGFPRTLCGQPCDGWNVDLKADALSQVACWTCRQLPTERHLGRYRTRDGAYDIVFDDNLDAWRDMAETAGTTLRSSIRGVWLIYETALGPEEEPVWFRGERAFVRFKDAHEALRHDAWGASKSGARQGHTGGG